MGGICFFKIVTRLVPTLMTGTDINSDTYYERRRSTFGVLDIVPQIHRSRANVSHPGGAAGHPGTGGTTVHEGAIKCPPNYYCS